MRFMLDANTAIYLLSGHFGVVRRASECFEDDLVISAIAFAEISLGSWNGKQPPLLLLDGFSRKIPVLPFDEMAARLYAQQPFKRGSFDRLIGAHALSLGLTLVTANGRDFADMPELNVENWAA